MIDNRKFDVYVTEQEKNHFTSLPSKEAFGTGARAGGAVLNPNTRTFYNSICFLNM